ncbi:quorum-sensing system DWW-type pheromone [Streptococcus ictaluri]|nr:quorum-sensing system DWW-type pheromone [Streptococcus ictaluri]
MFKSYKYYFILAAIFMMKSAAFLSDKDWWNLG